MDGSEEEPLRERKRQDKIEFDKISFLSRLFFVWTKKIFDAFNQAGVGGNELSSVIEVNKKDSAEVLKEKVERNWNQYQNIFKALVATFKFDIFLTGFITLLNEVIFRCMQPILLGKLLQFFNKNSVMTEKDALPIVIALITTLLFNILYTSHYSFRCYHAGLRMKSATSALLYQKLVTAGLGQVQSSRNGRIINIFASDVGKFDQMLYYSHLMWSSVALSVITSVLIVREIGPDGMYGVAVVLIVCPVQSWTGTMTTKFREYSAESTDKRVKLMSEILAGIETVKIQVWEKPFQAMVSKLREKELKWIARASYVRGLYMTFSIFTTRMALFVTLYVFINNGNELSPDRVFVVSSLFSILSNTLAGAFIRGVAELSEMRVSLRRIDEFLKSGQEIKIKTLLDRKDENRNINNSEEMVQPGNLIFEDATASWVEGGEVTLKRVNLRAEPGSLVAVIGAVGSGKSSLLQAVLGELEVSSGRAVVEARGVSYSSQEPWIFSGSVRENIVFGRPFERRRYNQVLRACCLLPDLKRMRNGDLTLVGERGGALSGGQKARLTLARAAYASPHHQQVDAYLLDEPLAALDVNVAKHVFEECVDGLLRGTTRILVTNQLHLLRRADLIVVLHDGAVLAQGCYQEIMENGKISDLMEVGNYQQMPSVELIEKTECIDASDVENDEKPDEEKIIEGRVSFSNYIQYWKSGASHLTLIILALLFFSTQFAASASDYWVSLCIARDTRPRPSANLDQDSKLLDRLLEDCLDTYTALIIFLFCIGLARSLLYFEVARRSSKELHRLMILSTMSAKMRFFLSTPVGRIINRFSSDLLAVDVTLPRIMLDTFQYLTLIAGALILIFTVSPVFILPVAVFFFVILRAKTHYLKVSQKVKRIDATKKSPIFTLLNDTIDGISTIGAFKKQGDFQEKLHNMLDENFASSFLLYSASTAFGFLLDALCLIFISILIIVCVIFADKFTAAEVGLAITQAMSITTLLQWCIRQSAETENLMTNFERAMEYTHLEKEDNKSVELKFTNWPIFGQISFKNVSLNIGLKSHILDNICMNIHGKTKVGIVGRTGAGKSSLVKVLFRLFDYQGVVKIDGVDISTLCLSKLRGKISMIPQDPVLFSGSVRLNLDPFNLYTDGQLFEAVKEVGLSDVITKVEEINCEHTATLSVGQKQLLCLARALLRKSKILILDEATANIDFKTDAMMQKLIGEKFQNCTIVTIAHRLHTISDSDTFIEIEKGKIVRHVCNL